MNPKQIGWAIVTAQAKVRELWVTAPTDLGAVAAYDRYTDTKAGAPHRAVPCYIDLADLEPSATPSQGR